MSYPGWRYRLIVCIFLALGGCDSGTDSKDDILSYNLLCSVCRHDPQRYEPWPLRRPHVFGLIDKADPDLIGLQEVYGEMLTDLREHYDERYAFYLGTLEDGSLAQPPGHLNIILYRKSNYRFVAGGSFRLAESPDPTSNRLQDAYRRTCSWAVLARNSGSAKDSAERFRFFSCHLPYSSPAQTRVAAQHLARWMADSEHNQLPQIVTGDFNASMGADSMRFLTGPVAGMPDYDYPPGFRPLVDDLKADSRIDFVLHSGEYQTAEGAVLGTSPYSGTFLLSDHPAILLRGSLR